MWKVLQALAAPSAPFSPASEMGWEEGGNTPAEINDIHHELMPISQGAP